MLEMPSGIGATAMGIGVSHSGSGAEGVTSGCRLRASSQGQQSQQQSSSNQQTTTDQQQQQQLQQLQEVQPQQQIKSQEQNRDQDRVGHAGRSKKDNCCLCWCCCCSCSCLAAVGTGNDSIATESLKKRGANSAISNSDIATSGHGGDLAVSSADHSIDVIDDLDDPPECCSLDEVRAWGKSFDKLMKSPAGRKLFREFLISEYSDENIAFWLACEHLKRENNRAVIEEKARYIYEDYISILSPKEVSLDSRVRDLINRNMVDPTPHTFDEAQLQIYTLMHRDSYPRFVNSDIFRRVARLGSGPPSPANAESDHGPPTGKSKSKKSVT